MPIKECQINGEQGYKWGEQGKCYTGPNAKEKAIAQGIAIGDYKYAESYNDYPEAVKNNAKRALKWVEENGWGTCGEATGKQRANQLANGENISRDTIARMASFKRHQQYKDVPYDKGCGGLMWDSWGGDEGIEWAQSKLKEIDKIKELSKSNKINNKIKSIKEVLQTYEKSGYAKIVKIGFDYDDTLTLVSTQDLVKRLISSGGNQIFIISARNNAALLYPMASKLGIPMTRVYAVGSNEKKVQKIKELGLDKFYDNNPDVIKELPGVGIKV